MLMNITLECLDLILKLERFFILLNSKENISLSCCLISDVHKIKSFLTEDEDSDFIPEVVISKFQNVEIEESCWRLYDLFFWIFETRKRKSNIPVCLDIVLTSVVTSLGRLSLFNSCMLVPSKAWDRGLDLTSFSSQNPIISLPVEFLQDRDILEEYLFR